MRPLVKDAAEGSDGFTLRDGPLVEDSDRGDGRPMAGLVLLR
jgi:hypothetical protein